MLWILVVWRMVTRSPAGSVSALLLLYLRRNLSMKLPTCLTRLKCSSAFFVNWSLSKQDIISAY
ncbi:unnamed protein product [Coffea canephora]|uniref:Uncharacterized protein n=1 Tax=Coffea canephora TaxID=49390 RepID=A0A068ULQ2_COFCA|nr:unnamed protein product [Coffea canephora]